MSEYSRIRRIAPLALTGFFTAFSRSGFKLWIMLAIISCGEEKYLQLPFLAALTAVCVLPGLLLPTTGGFTADRLPKRYVIIAVRIAELLLLTAGFYRITHLTAPRASLAILVIMLLHAALDCFFVPAFGGVIPETFPETELSGACGKITSFSVAGFIAGIVLTPLLFYYNSCFYILLFTAAAGIISAVKIVPVISPVQKQRELAYKFRETLPTGFRALRKNSGMLASFMGEVCFTGLGIIALPMLVLFCKSALHMSAPASIVLMLLAPGLGLAAGCFCAGMISGNKIELGLIPLGALGITAALPLIVFFPGSEHLMTISFPHSGNMEISFYTGAWFWSAFAGFSGGILLVPLRTYILQRLRPEHRGAALALKNSIAITVSFTAVLLVFFFAPKGEEVTGISPLLTDVAAVPYQVLIAGFGILVFLCTATAMWKLPNFMLRFIILTAGHSLYRIRISGAENIPERGPALLLCNHVSAIDSILISACTSRQIRFLLYEDYFSLPLLGSIARMTGFFQVPGNGNAKALVRLLKKLRNHLANDGLICVFPEGKLTRNGLMGEFKHGYEKMLPENVDVPIIPVNISFTWGSIFSNFFTRPGIRKKLQFPLFSAVTFGKPLPRDTTVFEIRQKIIELGAEAAEKQLPGEVTLHHAAVKLAKKYPFDKRFSDSSNRESTPFETARNAALLSRIIRRQISSQECRVGILLPNSIDAAEAIIAVLMADRIPVPLNYSIPQTVLDYSLDSAGITMVITSKEFLKKLRISPGEKAVFIEDMRKKSTFYKKFIMSLGLLCLPTGEFMNMLSPLSAFDLSRDAVLLFSSGSTGKPKGIRLSHHNLNINARSVASGFAVDNTDTVVGNLPLFHSFGLNVCFWMPILSGAKVTYIDNPLDSAAVCSTIARKRATMLFATPSFLQKYLHRCKKEELASLRLIATGAEKLREDIAQKVRDLTDNRLEVVECYGCTELSPVVSINLASDIACTGKNTGMKDSIGLPLENISVRILDPLNFTPVPPGEEGILCVKGSLVMQGYLNDEAATADVMAGEYYKTGDIARMDENGYITICGRLSRFSKIAGEMVPHEMVEKIINELCACDNRVVAVGSIPDKSKGEALLVLYTPEMPFTPEEVVAELRERSISNLWIPKAVNFHKVDHLPLLGSGKLDLALLREMAEHLSRA